MSVRQDEPERLVLAALQSRLMGPALCAEFCEEYTRYLNKLRSEKNATLAAAKAEVGKLAKQRENLIQAIKDGVPASEGRMISPASPPGAKSCTRCSPERRKSRSCCIPTWRAITANRLRRLPKP